MKALDRRDCIKMMSGLALAAAGGMSLPLTAQEKKSAGPAAGGDSWKRVDQAEARDLVENAIKAARGEMQAQREVNASKRAEILLGANVAKNHKSSAAQYYEQRTAALRATKDSLARWVKSAGTAGEKKFSAFAAKGELKAFADQARKSTIQSLMNSDVSPQEAQTALRTLDEVLSKVQSFKSFQETTAYLDQHLDKLIGRKMPDEDPNGFCLLILLIFGIYAVMVMAAILACLFSSETNCVATRFNNMLVQLCGQ